MSNNNLTNELSQFTGTEQYYYNPLFPSFKYTDGIKYLAEKADAYWLIDFVFSFCEVPALEEEQFQVWQMTINEDDSALIRVEDGNNNELKQFKIPFTDFPLPSFELWFIDGILILPSEY